MWHRDMCGSSAMPGLLRVKEARMGILEWTSVTARLRTTDNCTTDTVTFQSIPSHPHAIMPAPHADAGGRVVVEDT